MIKEFEKWMIHRENKSQNTAYQYARSIEKISKHYNEQTGKRINLYKENNMILLKEIANEYSQHGMFSKYGNKGNGTIRNAIATYIRFLENNHYAQEKTATEDIEAGHSNEAQLIANMSNFTYERDLKNSLISQAETLFPGYKIFGSNQDGIEYSIEGKRIDLLLENKTDNTLLVIELKAGIADFRAFGQISMYLGLLSKKFPDRNIKGIIISSEVDDSLKNACLITDKVDIKIYKMQLSLDEVF